MSKRQTLKLHRWLGIALLLPLFLQTVTGLMLVYKWPLAQWLDPIGMQRVTTGAKSSVGLIVERATATWEQRQLQRLYFPESKTGTFFLVLQNRAGEKRYASVDPGSGEVLREGSRWQFPVEAALQLHFQPLQNRLGNSLVLLTGCGVLLLAGVGVVAWWPREGHWRQSLVLRRGLRTKLMLRQLHRNLAILLLPVLLTIATTGSLMALEIVLQDTTTGSSTPDLPAPPPTGARVDAAIELARTVVPSARLRDISFPDGRIKVLFHAPEVNGRAVHSVLMGDKPLRIMNYLPAQENTAWWVTMLPIHSGDIMSPWGNWIVLGAGFCLLVIGGLGAWLCLPERTK